jgi:hypothetical protein
MKSKQKKVKTYEEYLERYRELKKNLSQNYPKHRESWSYKEVKEK